MIAVRRGQGEPTGNCSGPGCADRATEELEWRGEMKLIFVGAAHEVTGSCHYLNACGKNILVDYGMEQGVNVFENCELPVAEASIDYVLLTHAHVDHSGMIPQLTARGFRGQIYTTLSPAFECARSPAA